MYATRNPQSQQKIYGDNDEQVKACSRLSAENALFDHGIEGLSATAAHSIAKGFVFRQELFAKKFNVQL